MTLAAAQVAWVGLGSNVGRREAALAALRSLLDRPPLRVAAVSRELVTRPVGVTTQPDFLNQVLRLEVRQQWWPPDWLDACRQVELAAGRRPTYRWGPRRADVDLLLLGANGEIKVDSPPLVVPHPGLAERPFLCALLAELDPQLRHPQGWRLAERAGRFAPGA